MIDNILVLHYYKSTVDGVMTSLIDTFNNIRRAKGAQEERDVRMKIICPELYLMDIDDYYNDDLNQTQWYEYIDDVGLDVKPYNADDMGLDFHFKTLKNKLTTAIPFLRFNRNFGDFNLVHSIDQKNHKFKAHTVICSARLLYEILMGVDIDIECERLYVLDSLDTYKSKVGIFPDFDDLFDTMFKNSNITQLSNPANFRETKYRQKEYYHKFSSRRLTALKQSDILKNDYTFNRTKKKKTMIHEGSHFENMGKGIFEHLWHGYKVKYEAEGIYTRDGLWYYMNLFGLDADKDQIISMAKTRIRDNLFYKSNDILFTLKEGK